jgi:hypothetical protein
MRIIIPTKGRRNNQLTLRNLPRELQEQTTLVTAQRDMPFLKEDFPHVEVIAQPDPEMGIAEKRKWIIETASTTKIVMLDDDLRFAVRRIDNPGLFRKAEKQDILDAFNELSRFLSPEFPHAGFAVRGSGIGDAAKKGGWQTTGKRMMYSLGYYVPTLLEHAQFGRIGTHEDMDVTLQLLRKGFPNAVNFSFVTDQAFGNPGGCTSERTLEKNNEDVLKLAQFHPEYVRTTWKSYKASPDRLECVVQWQRALQDGIGGRKADELAEIAKDVPDDPNAEF